MTPTYQDLIAQLRRYRYLLTQSDDPRTHDALRQLITEIELDLVRRTESHPQSTSD
jgi:hypothetical protein